MTRSGDPGPPATREKASWCIFDFANSSFTTVIVTVVYARYFVKVVVPDGSWAGVPADSWWAGAGVVSNVLVILSAPVIGAMADRRAAKHRYLLVTTLVCVGATALLSVWGAGAVIAALLCFIIANIAFSSGENLVAGFLPELAPPDQMGRLSAYGWTVGYFGGLLALVLSLLLVNLGGTRWVPIATAAFFGIAALPTFLWLKERAQPKPGRVRMLAAAFGELSTTWRERTRFRDLFTFLGAILLFQGGVAVVISFSAIYAEFEIGMNETEIIGMFMGLQIAAAGGAFAFGWIQDRVGSRAALLNSLGLWIVAVTIAYLARTPGAFIAAGLIAGAAMGASQSASRALIGLFCPAGREGEWFGLWGLATKGAAVLGLAFYGVLMATTGDRRLAILATLALFVLGAIGVMRVDVNRGRQTAQDAEAPPLPSL